MKRSIKNQKEEQLKDMAEFYLKELFHNIPIIPVTYSDTMEDGLLGTFYIEKNDDYDPDEDELINAYEYRSRYKSLWDGLVEIDLAREESYMDPLNHPLPEIRINRKIADCARELVSTLLHELLHYYCWYTGLEYHDDSRDFLEKCKEMDLPDNYTCHRWNGYKWIDSYDYTKVDKYIRMYICEQKNETSTLVA